ncbi:MAG: HNH endonuclease family protein, partial [Candidatus Contendobacter sp.]|nr:HNH endonuclease family protein [Candidatus Contendobacter sp.]
FRAAFTDKSIKTTATRNNKVVRYILCKLERQSSGLEVDFDSSSYTVEHILPQNPGKGWQAFRDSDLESFIYRIGNMSMLEAGKNRDLENAPFADKKPILQGSTFALTKKVAEDNADWTPERIESRQRALANIATSVWRIAQLS